MGSDSALIVQEYIEKYSSFALFTHEYCDGDAIGSTLALAQLLEKLGKKVSCRTPRDPSPSFSFVPGIEKLRSDFDYGSYDALIFLDFTPYVRISGFTAGRESYFDELPRLVIDHHVDVELKGAIHVTDPTASSTCEWLYELISPHYEHLIESALATSLLLGILTDTGGFSYEKDSLRTFGVVEHLLRHGAHKHYLVSHLNGGNSLGSLHVLGMLIERITISPEGLLSTRYRQDELPEGVGKEEAELYFGSVICALGGVKTFVLLRILDGFVKGSLRSRNNVVIEHDKQIVLPGVDVATLAKQCFGGGGHRNAAGFKLPLEQDFVSQKDSICVALNSFLASL